jgi:hypothetical protein
MRLQYISGGEKALKAFRVQSRPVLIFQLQIRRTGNVFSCKVPAYAMSRLLVPLGLRLSARRKAPTVPGVDLSVPRFLKPRLSVSSVRQNFEYSVSLASFGLSSKGGQHSSPPEAA